MASQDLKIYGALPPDSRRWMLVAAILLLASIACGGWVYSTWPETPPAPVPLKFIPAAVETKIDSQASAISKENEEETPQQMLERIKTHLLVHLRLDADFVDSSAAANKAQIVGDVKINNKDGSARFGGKQDWIELPHVRFDAPFSVCLWIKLDEDGPFGLVEQFSSPEENMHLHIMLKGNPYLGFMMNDLAARSPVRVEDGWTHLVFLYSGSYQQIWVNGELSIERPAPPFEGTKGLTMVGKAPVWNNVPTRNFKGCMRDLRIYDIGLTNEQIHAIGHFTTTAKKYIEKPEEF